MAEYGGCRLRRLALVMLGLAGMIFASAADARLIRHPAFQSGHVAARDVTVWLPDGYREDGPPLPVIYMQDGQNLHDSARSFGGVSWVSERRSRA